MLCAGFFEAGGEIGEGVVLMQVARLLGALQACATCTGSDTNGWEWNDSLDKCYWPWHWSTDIWSGVYGRVTKSTVIETGANVLGTGVVCIWTVVMAGAPRSCWKMDWG